jgi:hypothetical protein
MRFLQFKERQPLLAKNIAALAPALDLAGQSILIDADGPGLSIWGIGDRPHQSLTLSGVSSGTLIIRHGFSNVFVFDKDQSTPVGYGQPEFRLLLGNLIGETASFPDPPSPKY